MLTHKVLPVSTSTTPCAFTDTVRVLNGVPESRVSVKWPTSHFEAGRRSNEWQLGCHAVYPKGMILYHATCSAFPLGQFFAKQPVYLSPSFPVAVSHGYFRHTQANPQRTSRSPPSTSKSVTCPDPPHLTPPPVSPTPSLPFTRSSRLHSDLDPLHSKAWIYIHQMALHHPLKLLLNPSNNLAYGRNVDMAADYALTCRAVLSRLGDLVNSIKCTCTTSTLSSPLQASSSSSSSSSSASSSPNFVGITCLSCLSKGLSDTKTVIIAFRIIQVSLLYLPPFPLSYLLFTNSSEIC